MARIHRRTVQKTSSRPDNHDGVITDLEPDILECEIKWALRSITTEKSQWRWWNSSWAIPNPERWRCEMLHSICQQIWNTQQWPQDWKTSVFISFPKKGHAKECSNYHTIALISHANKIKLKIHQDRLQHCENWGLSYVQAGFKKARRIIDQIPTSAGP